MNFFKSFLASFLAVIAAVIIGIPLLIALVGGFIAGIAGNQEEIVVSDGTVLHMKLNTQIVENATEDPFESYFNQLPFAEETSSQLGMFDIVESIKKAASDDRVKGIYLNLQGGVATGWANMSTIRNALLDFKNSGKFIYAYSEIYSENSYYLASVADSVLMAPEGIMEFNGFVSSPVFFKGMFDKIDVKPKIYRVGTYKAAVEPFLRKKMSRENKEQTAKYIGDLWDVFVSDVAVSRNISPETLNQVAEEFIFGDAQKAQERGLIDGSAYTSSMMNKLKAALGKTESEKVNLLSFKKYTKVPNLNKNFSKNKIAVVVAEGQIQSGKSRQGVIGSETIVKALRKARMDDNVKGIVFRVNSPGGSALASDMILDEVKLCSESKPVVASMGNYAASGGYYISSSCDKIFAQENTITGSIGIFAILYEADKALDNYLGFTFDEVETHKYANIGNPAFPSSSAEDAFFQNWTNRGYSNFIQIVKEGRGFQDSASVDKIAQGRVWSGKDAMGINLVDEMGDMWDAVYYVAKEAGVENDYRVVLSPRPKTTFDMILEGMNETLYEKALKASPVYDEIKRLESLKNQIPGSGMYMLMPYDLEIE